MAVMDYVLFTPSWFGERINPKIANGDILGWFGNSWAAVLTRMGSVTTYGVGAFIFQVPIAPIDGSATLRHGNRVWTGKTLMSSARTVRLLVAEQLVGPTYPFAFATGDEIRIQLGDVPDSFHWQHG